MCDVVHSPRFCDKMEDCKEDQEYKTMPNHLNSNKSLLTVWIALSILLLVSEIGCDATPTVQTQKFDDAQTAQEGDVLPPSVISIEKKSELPNGHRMIESTLPRQQEDESQTAEQPKEPVSPLDLPPVPNEDYEAERERILAEEKAKEWAVIDEEQQFVPLVDEPDKLVPLDLQDRIWITPDRKSVVLTGRVVLRDGFLELLACRVRTKEHESILSVRVKPFLIHAALLAANARQGKPAQFEPVFVPASGDQIDIHLRWKDETGKTQESSAQDWVWDMASPENAKKPMMTHWVFSGSKEYQDDSGTIHYVADETGELFGLSNFVGSILDIPIESSADNTQLQFGCFTERIPPLGTLVTILLTPVR